MILSSHYVYHRDNDRESHLFDPRILSITLCLSTGGEISTERRPLRFLVSTIFRTSWTSRPTNKNLRGSCTYYYIGRDHSAIYFTRLNSFKAIQNERITARCSMCVRFLRERAHHFGHHQRINDDTHCITIIMTMRNLHIQELNGISR